VYIVRPSAYNVSSDSGELRCNAKPAITGRQLEL
jgi:hypothetical protein